MSSSKQVEGRSYRLLNSVDPSTTGKSQTLLRALDILELFEVEKHSLEVTEVALMLSLPTATVHRLCRTLVDRGFIRQLADRSYTLGVRLVPLGNAANTFIGLGAEAVLEDVVQELGESANLAVIAGHQVEYVAQVPSNYSMRMFTEVGRRVDMHCTGVGKAMLAQLDEDAVDSIIRRTGLGKLTPYTINTRIGLATEMQKIREQGYALDEQEQELGVRCIAVPIQPTANSWMALSVSGPLTRMTDDLVQRAVPLLQNAALRLVEELR